jgi:uncharacterized protein (TIGR03790 family)
VALFLTGTISLPPGDVVVESLQPRIFDGFSTEDDYWNETPFGDIAVPDGFDQFNSVDYSDVGVLINNQSELSRTIGWAFVTARNISADRVFIFDNESNPTGETINREQFNTSFLEPFRAMLSNRSSSIDLNYLVTTKGVPLRINGGADKAAFDQEIALVGGTWDSSIGSNYWINHDYGPLAGGAMEAFTREEYGFFLVTRLTGYTVDTALGLIEKANNSYSSRGVHVLDLATNRNGSGYKYWNDDLYVANNTLNGTMNLPVSFDEETEFVTNLSNVIGYASWGSNDGNWNSNFLPNAGFDTVDSSWSSGSKYWDAFSPPVSPGDEFNWSYQTEIKQGGNGAMEARITSECSQESGDMVPGIFAEYFDNEGISFNTATMPDLIDRIPDHVRLESELAHSSSYNPYSGLDNRFKHNWGARFSGLIDVPESGNWTLYLNSDDGSELWIDDVSAVQNHGSHGMREFSTTLSLTAGYHDFRIEFFQGGGPHGLLFSWQGPNVSKTTIPASAFVVSGDYIPQQDSLIHNWDFEEGIGNQSNDSITNDSNFTLYGMDSSNWKSCIDGNCLWYDGANDYAKVDVDDWLGNFTISQWVWANITNQTNYAATFAIDDNSGSNYSFQHMVSNSKWNLHNNQSKEFGDVEPQQWAHLVTVFDGGNTRQYLDGVLVNSNTYPNGSMNNFDLYKLGVNRAGNSFFEGMIDNLMIWDTALSNGSITTLSRDIINNCSAYSGNGQGVAYLETTYSIPTNFTNHAWVIYGHGERTGDVYGEYNIEVASLDSNGTVLFTNTSSNQPFTTSWNSRTMRFRPHLDSTSLRIRVSLDIVPTSTDGSLFIDSTALRIIRPHMDWVNGSIAETAVSTGGRSFNWGTGYGQSLVADLLEDGVSGVKGYVYEPYLTAVSYPSVLLSSYSTGYTMAESYYASNRLMGWMGVVVGDPKMSAYGDIVHDVEVVDARIVGNMSLDENVTIQIIVQNLAAGDGEGWLVVRDQLGGEELANYSLSTTAGDLSGSRQMVNLTINSSRAGWNNIEIRYDAINITRPERIIDNNVHHMMVWVNSPPTVETLYCDSSHYSRGDLFTCSGEISDDSGIAALDLAWRVRNNQETTEWSWGSTGSQDGTIWWTSFELPTDIILGSLDLKAIAYDESNQTHQLITLDVALVDDAPAIWFGVHVEGVDSQEWGGASVLEANPIAGVLRAQVTLLKACVLDADHVPVNQTPSFISSRGQIDGMTWTQGSTSSHHCYVSSFTIPSGSSLDRFVLELYDYEGNFLTRRNIGISDRTPLISLELIDDEGDEIDRLIGGGDENIKAIITDLDDGVEGAYGDLYVTWPGQATQSIPLLFEDGSITIPLSTENSLESGDVLFEVIATGANGASDTISATYPLLLTTPEVVLIELCDGEDGSLSFGISRVVMVLINSTRPIDITTAQIQQHGWTVSAPEVSADDSCQSQLQDHSIALYFRVQLDSSFVPGTGTVNVLAKDIDGLSSSGTLQLQFLETPPSIIVTVENNFTAGDLFEITVEFYSYLGPDGSWCGMTTTSVESQYEILNRSGNLSGVDDVGIWTTNWLLPITLEGEHLLSLNCTTSRGGQVSYQTIIEIKEWIPSVDDNNSNSTGDYAEGGDSTGILPWVAGLVVIIILLTTIFTRARAREEEIVEWAVEEEAQRDERIPEGWTLEEFTEWLNGPMPDDWEAEQWSEYRTKMEDLL